MITTSAEKYWYHKLGSGHEAASFRTILAQLQAGAVELWDTDRVVRNFTDHGPRHAERVIRKLAEIHSQRAKTFRDFDTVEVFVLIAAAYLHDIGMQCATLPLLRRVTAVVRSKTPAEYTPHEQAEIRSHHHLLTAEMIQAAFQATKPGQLPQIATAIKSIPADLVSPIKDVAKYHSKLDIGTCPEFFRATKRRRLLAVLLRLADELDICQERIDINDVALSPKPLESEYWWWIHYYTTAIEVRGNRVLFHMRLNPNDSAVERTIETVVAEGFKRKNLTLTDHLTKHGIPLAYAPDVEWEYDENLPRLSDEMKDALQQALVLEVDRIRPFIESRYQSRLFVPTRDLSIDDGRPPGAWRHRPLMGGDSVGGLDTTAGSICCFVRDSDGVYLLSSALTLIGDLNSPRVMSPVLQPSVIDGGRKDGDTVAHLARWSVPLVGSRRRPRPGGYDAAIARLVDERSAVPAIRQIGALQGIGGVEIGSRVRVSGRSAAVTEGHVVTMDTVIRVEYPHGAVVLDNLIMASIRATPGDQGAPVVNDRGELVGMLLAGSGGETPMSFVLPIQIALSALGVDLVCAG